MWEFSWVVRRTGAEAEYADWDRVLDELAELDEVCAVNVVSGEFDLEVLILSADHETLRDFVSSRLSAIDGIESLSPALGLELFKLESTWSKF